MRWLWIALGVIVVLLLLSWLFGWMGTNDDLTDVPVEGDTVIEGSTNEVIEDAGEGAAATGNAIEGAAEETGEAVEGAAEEAGDALETETVPAEPTD
jgi:hypothetical protein